MSIRNWSATTKRMRSSAAAIGVAGAVALGSLAVGGAFAQPTDQQAIGTGTIVTAGQVGANCRAEPSIDAQFLTLVPDGQTVTVTGAAENDFLPVICNDQNGWIYAPLVTNIIPATPVATPATPAATEAATEAPATAVASPAAAVPAWVDAYAVNPDTVVEGDSATVGVTVGDALEINQPAFETRPYVVLQTTNATEQDATLVLFTAPEGTDATGFTIPAEESALPAGVTPYASYEVAAGEVFGAVLPELPAGTYILADTNDQALTFTVNPQSEIEVPDIFASPSATEAATPAATEAATPAATEAVTEAATPEAAAPAWVDAYTLPTDTEANGDTATVGVALGDALEINQPAFETRPYVTLQTTNNTDTDATFVLFTAPEGTDATGFTIPAEETGLPDGVTPYASYSVAPGEVYGAVLPELPAGTYILASTSGQATSFTVNPQSEIVVPDIFASPSATTAPTETPTVEPTATGVPTETPTTEPTATETPTTEPTATETPTAEPTATEVPTETPTTEPTATEVPATPIASPATAVASPATAVPAWVSAYALDPNATAEGDSTSVGVTVGDALEINVPAFETRPNVILQTTNATEQDATLVLFTAPEGTDATGFTIPAEESALPAGVTPYASYEVAAGEVFGAVLPELPAGTYILADTNDQALTFTVNPQSEIEVPDIFASPSATEAATPAATEAATETASPVATPAASPASAVPAWVATYALDPKATAEGDSTSVGVTAGAEALEINVPAFETRPNVILQTTNATEEDVTLVLFTAPEGTDATGFTIPAEESALPKGVKASASYTVKPGEVFGAVLKDLAPGTYILADSNGHAITFTVNPQAEIDVPDIFASPEGTPGA